ncbi:MAG: glycine--tRNA ligase [Patescibacteria group bacterium]|nr:glycine--tRNA ligase [Patescibacteria group bacterium]
MEDKLEKIVSWAKRRGFIIPGSEIYGGIGGVYDFGPYGVALKNNIKKLWWQTFVSGRDDVVGMESAILMNRKVWQASGHEKGFVDELVECKKCHRRFKADDLSKEKCSSGGEHELTEPKAFNTMFKTDETYLRPETAQGMFTDFRQIAETSRQKIPFGIAQMGKSFRNEINTKDFLFRVREFEIAEIEYFVKPGDDEKSFDEWLKAWEDFVLNLGIKKENLEQYEHPKEGLAHYSKRTVDIQYKFPFGTKELAGVANRTDFDLKSHEEASGKDLKYFDEETKEKYWPYVIEPTMGIERLMLAIICDAFEELEARTETTEAKTENEIVLHFSPQLAPIKVAVLPLVKKLSEETKKIYQDLKTCWGDIEFDESGSIGRRYRRQDEIGTPYCVTFDFDSLEDKKVTVRDRDTMKQERIEISELKNFLFRKLNIS